MKTLLSSLVILLPLISSAADPINTCKGMTKEQIAKRRERLFVVNGPIIAQPNSQHGCIGVVNSVTELQKVDLAQGLAMYGKGMSPYNVKLVQIKTAPTVTTANAMREDAKLDFAVFIVADDNLPAFLTAPEDKWAIVNSKACKTASRTIKMVAKAFAYIAGAATSSGLSFLSTTKPEELDMVKYIEFPFDVQQRIDQHLKLNKVTPEHRRPYRIACKEGWAPAPTNDIQKAIWDKVHALPKRPMKIEFDPKKGR